MGKQYTEKEIHQKCDEALKNPASFYAKGFVNYRGCCPDAGIPYTEVVAEYLCRHLQEYINGIPMIRRTLSYRTYTHDGVYSLTSNREEEITAMKMFNFCKSGGCYEKIGEILDYQTPLKDRQRDKAGKIDLLAYDGKILRMLELKKPHTGETILRCVLEGYTYLRTADTAKLTSDFNIPTDTPVKASPFVFENSLPYKEYRSDRPHLKKLMELLDSEPFFIRQVSDEYEVF